MGVPATCMGCARCGTWRRVSRCRLLICVNLCATLPLVPMAWLQSLEMKAIASCWIGRSQKETFMCWSCVPELRGRHVSRGLHKGPTCLLPLGRVKRGALPCMAGQSCVLGACSTHKASVQYVLILHGALHAQNCYAARKKMVWWKSGSLQ